MHTSKTGGLCPSMRRLLRRPWAAASAALLLLGLAIPAFAQDKARTAPRKPPSHQSLRAGMFSLTKLETVPYVMLGDSLTERAQWAEITGCPFVANRGIGGDTSAGVLRRLDEVIKLRPLAVFLMIGVNDIASGIPPERIAENVSEIVDRLGKANIQVFLSYVLPVTPAHAHRFNGRVGELNQALSKIVERTGVATLDLRPLVRDANGSLRDEFSTDGLHLSTEGYRVWRDAVIPHLSDRCPPVAKAAKDQMAR
jgi:lysophospholipase L1-like esterase